MKSAVLFIIFKREEITRKTFARIREARPPKLYIAADGPHRDNPEEIEKCQATRKVVESVDWPCEVFHLYRNENIGCGKGVCTAISWFFDHEDQGIIIEDDILPHVDFFRYCDEMLERYKDDEKIQMICGRNYFYDGWNSDSSYYLSLFSSIWGWATWKRVWSTYDFDLNNYPQDILRKRLKERLPLRSARYFLKIYEKMRAFKIDSWDYQFFINSLYYNRYSIMPYINLIENIGFGDIDATHTKNFSLTNSKFYASSPYPLIHPSVLEKNEKADRICFEKSGLIVQPILIRAYRRILRLFERI